MNTQRRKQGQLQDNKDLRDTSTSGIKDKLQKKHKGIYNVGISSVASHTVKTTFQYC
jgi:hypothetical protein